MSSHVPEGFHSVTPFLCLVDADGFIVFLQQAFKAQIHLLKKEEGVVRHAEVIVEGSIIEIAEARPDGPETNTAFHLFVTDPDAVQTAAIKAGATSTFDVAEQDYGERSGGVKDRWGNNWYIAKVTDAKKRRGI